MNLFIFGAGYTAQHFARQQKISPLTLAGTTREVENFDALSRAGISPLLFDGEMAGEDLVASLKTTTHLLISIAAPRQRTKGSTADPVLRATRDVILDQMPSLQWVGYLSTVGVYGNHDGAWIDEQTECRPVSERSINRLVAEQEWQAMAESREIPVAILRLSGIYGPARNIFKAIAEGRSRRMVKKGQVFNRIHVADIATAIESAATGKVDGIFNITDNEPAPPQDVVTFAHGLVGSEPPEEIDFETADITPMARSFYGENKRVSNAKSKQQLGLVYRYPDYRTSLTEMWNQRQNEPLY